MADPSQLVAVILAAGRGERLGRDKALVPLPDEAAARVVSVRCREGGCDDVLFVRQRGADPLPTDLGDDVVEVDSEEMVESLRAGLAELGRPKPAAVLVLPIDYAMVGAGTIASLTAAMREAPSGSIVLPICRGRPGHPVGLCGDAVEEVSHGESGTLRDVIRRDPSRVVPVAVEDGWVLRDIDTPGDLRAAQGALANAVPATVLMARHRSRRSYRSDPVETAQIEWLVDSARFASTSSFIQAYSVIAVRDVERKAAAARLCADQRHIHEAPVFLAICADLHKLSLACAKHGRPLHSDSLEIFVQATVDAALLGQNLQLAAESEGLGSCMIGAARNHPVELAELLCLPPHVYVVFGMTLGWPADDPEPRGRMPLAAVLHHERYRSEGLPALLDEADEAVRAWARRSNARTADSATRKPDESRGWTDRMAWLFGGESPPKGRALLLEHVRRLGFGLRAPEGSGEEPGPPPGTG
jgi:CTP:molybdopterin cytidylyltransferase MocA/nitroreductase